MVGHKTSLNKLKRIEIMHNMVSEHKEIKVELSNRRVSGHLANIWKLNKTPLNNPYVKEKITREIRKYFELTENEITTDQSGNMQLSNNKRHFLVLNKIRKSVSN